MIRVLYETARIEKAGKVKKKVLEQIKGTHDRLRESIINFESLDEINGDLEEWEKCIEEDYALTMLKKYVSAEAAFMLYDDGADGGTGGFVVSEKMLDIWLRDDYDFVSQFLVHAEDYAIEDILDEAFFADRFTGMANIIRYEAEHGTVIIGKRHMGAGKA